MTERVIPTLPESEIEEWQLRATESPRHRVPKILHEPGAEFNEVFNFMTAESYMQPHLHPGAEKIEKIYLVRGRLAVLYFDDAGAVRDVFVLEKGGQEKIEVPAFTWHTYVMLTDAAVTYETMMGQYEPSSWKDFAAWAPKEESDEADEYLASLKQHASR